MDYSRNARYFSPTPFPRPIIVLAIIGLILLIAPAMRLDYSGSWLWGLGMISPWRADAIVIARRLWGLGAIVLAVIMWWRVRYASIPTDAEIDKQRDSFMNALKDQAIRKFGIDEEEANIAPPLFLRGYSFGCSILSGNADQNVPEKQGKDGRWRSAECVLSAIFFTEHEIHRYTRIVSLVSDAFKECAEEFFYKDIVSIKTEFFYKGNVSIEKAQINPNPSVECPTPQYPVAAFMIRDAGGETMKCACDSTEEADSAVNAMCNLVRQKKNA